QTGEERRPVAGEDGMDDELVLVDEAELLQLGGERGAAEQHLARGLPLERDDGLAQVAQEVDGVLPGEVLARARDHVLALPVQLLRPVALVGRRLLVTRPPANSSPSSRR